MYASTTAPASEIPYVLRVRRDVETRSPSTPGNSIAARRKESPQASYDLGEATREHNEVDIQTDGNNFRRLADVDGSSDGVHWSPWFPAPSCSASAPVAGPWNSRPHLIPVSRYRYLRVRVNRDPQVDRAAPELGTVRIRRTVQQKGEMVTFPGILQAREPDRDNGRPASVWRIGLGGHIPFERVVIVTAEGSFSRPFRLDDVDDPTAPGAVASGELVRREFQPAELAIEFPERFARQLKLTVTDDRNPPLGIAGITVQSAARQVILEAASALPGPIRAYYGNPKAAPPHYDLAARLPAEIVPPVVRLALGEERENPIYSPEPKPFSERSPWLVYVVLGAAAVVLAAILLSLVRQSGRRAPAV